MAVRLDLEARIAGCRRHDATLETLGQGTAIAGLKFFQPLPPVAAQRLVSGDALAIAP
jgi:hypothetical protein